jgi:hypothetical protein
VLSNLNVFVLLPSAATQHPWLLTIPMSTATINVPSFIVFTFFVLTPFINISSFYSLPDKQRLTGRYIDLIINYNIASWSQ